MSLVQYGSCIMSVTRTNYYKREAVYHGSTYLHTKHTISLRCIFNPATQRDRLEGEPPATPPQQGGIQITLPDITPQPPVGPHKGELLRPGDPQPGNPGSFPGAATSRAVRAVLLQPRLQFRWTVSNYPIIVAPLPGFTVDSDQGPKPISCDIVEINGGKTFVVDWVVSIALNEAPLFTNFPHPVLAHEYLTEHEIDEHFLAVRLTQGAVRFDPQILRLRGGTYAPDPQGRTIADYFRDYFFLPVPPNMAREKVVTRLDESGCLLTYSIIDRERHLNLPSPFNTFVTKVEGTHRVKSGLPQWGLSAFGLTFSLHHLLARGAQPSNSPLSPLWGWNFRGDTSARDNFLSWYTRMAKLASITEHLFALRVWGHRGATRHDLMTYGQGLIQSRVNFLAGSLPMMVSYELGHVIEGRMVELAATMIGGPLNSNGFMSAALGPNNLQVFGPIGPLSDDSPGHLVRADGLNTPLPNGAGTRGTYLESLVATALSAPHEPANISPAAPTNYRGVAVRPSGVTWPKVAPDIGLG